ncbi:MoaD/ThiS family protein [Candidatus Woesearchaeota archaeon]|nr:MoaD/ThiS family protein [Candidatus Woesearchaeota archaeon]
MKIEVCIPSWKEKKSVVLKEKATVKDLLDKLNLNPVTVIVAVNNEASIESRILRGRDTVKIIPVVSGG